MSLIFDDKITFYDVDADGDVEVEISTKNGHVNAYLTQRAIKELIDFLEAQINKA